MVAVSIVLRDFHFLHSDILWFVNAGNCGEHHNVDREYAGKNFHN